MRHFRVVLAGIVFATAAFCAANDQLNQVLKQLERTHSFSGVTISPDGRWITWVESDGGDSRKMYLLEWGNSSAKPQAIAVEAESAALQEGVAWSPDSRKIAFLATGASSRQQQVYVMTAPTGKATQVTDLDGYVTHVAWSPDGKRLAFLYAEHGGGEGPLEAVPAQVGVIGSELHNQQIGIADPDNGRRVQLVSPANLNVYEYDWSPDGARFAAIAAPGPANNNWWTAQLYTVAIGQQEMKAVYHPPVEQQIAVPKWSPDGKQIAFIGGLMSDEGFVGGDIFLVGSDGGDARNLTPERKSSPSGFVWRKDGKLVFTETVDGGGAISTLDPGSGQTETLWRGSQSLHQDGNFPDLYFAADARTSVAMRSSWEQAPEVWAGPVGDWRQMTRANAAERKFWGRAESVHWTESGNNVQGWLLYPDHFDPQKRYPMIVEIHGGPASGRSASWPSARFDMSVMAALGYFVLFPNPRGSYGEGEAFTRANVKDFGYGDLRDVLAGVDAVVAKAPVDNDRVGVTGWSYGGFMTMWTVTQTQRFRAAVAGAGIADWLSYYGENSIDEWMIPYFGKSVYDDPAVYAKSSPITYIKNVKTPTLVVVGERDGECPAPQSFEFWHALQNLDIPTQLVVYPGEGHAFHDPKDRLDVMRRSVEWFDQYLGSRQ